MAAGRTALVVAAAPVMPMAITVAVAVFVGGCDGERDDDLHGRQKPRPAGNLEHLSTHVRMSCTAARKDMNLRSPSRHMWWCFHAKHV